MTFWPSLVKSCVLVPLMHTTRAKKTTVKDFKMSPKMGGNTILKLRTASNKYIALSIYTNFLLGTVHKLRHVFRGVGGGCQEIEKLHDISK